MDTINIILITSAAIALSIALTYVAIRLIKSHKQEKLERGTGPKVPLFLKLFCKRIAHKHHGIYCEAVQAGDTTTPLVFIGDTVFVFNGAKYRGKAYLPYEPSEPWIVNGKKVSNPVSFARASRDLTDTFMGPKGFRVLDVIYTPFLKRKDITLDKKGISLFTAVVMGMKSFENVFAMTETPSSYRMAKATWDAFGDALLTMADDLSKEKPQQEGQPSSR